MAIEMPSLLSAQRARKEAVLSDNLKRPITESIVWRRISAAIILFFAAMLGVAAQFGPGSRVFDAVDSLLIWFFYALAVEMTLTFLLEGPRRFFTNGRRWFDLLVLGTAWFMVFPQFLVVRVLGVVSLIKKQNEDQRLRRKEVMIRALLGALSAGFAFAAAVYVAAILGVLLFRDDWGFRDLGQSLLSLTSLLSEFSSVVERAQDSSPYAWVYFVAVAAVLLASFNVARSAYTSALEAVSGHSDPEPATTTDILKEVKALKAEITALRRQIEIGSDV